MTARPEHTTDRRRSLLVVAIAVAIALGALAISVAFDLGSSRPVPALAPPQAGPAGTQDLVYGEDGLVRLDIGRDTQVRDAVPARDGGLVVLGRAGTDRVGFVLRLDPDGTPTTGFAADGVATLGSWTPSRVAVAADGAVVVAGGAVDTVVVWRGDASGRAVERAQSVAVPVPERDVGVGVLVSDVHVAPDGTVTVAGGVHINRADDVGGCCAIEPDSLPFRLRLLPPGEPDQAYGPDGFVLDEVRPGEGGTAGRLPGSAQRDRVNLADADERHDALGFTAAVTVALPDGGTAIAGTAAAEARSGVDFVVVARTGR